MNNINEWTFQNLICDNGISKIYKAVKSDGTNSVIKHLRLPIDSNRAMELVNRGKISTVNDSINYYVNEPVVKEPTYFDKYWEYMINFFTSKNTKKLLVTDDFWSWETIDNPIHEVCKRNNYQLIKLGDLGADSTNKALGEFEHPGVEIHPNDKGMREIANRILTEGKLI